MWFVARGFFGQVANPVLHLSRQERGVLDKTATSLNSVETGSHMHPRNSNHLRSVGATRTVYESGDYHAGIF
jgi:hypothetical protein